MHLNHQIRDKMSAITEASYIIEGIEGTIGSTFIKRRNRLRLRPNDQSLDADAPHRHGDRVNGGRVDSMLRQGDVLATATRVGEVGRRREVRFLRF